MGSKGIECVCFGFSHSLPFGNSYECGTCSEQVCKMLSFFFFSQQTPQVSAHHFFFGCFLLPPPCWHFTLILLSYLWQMVDVVTFSLAGTGTSLVCIFLQPSVSYVFVLCVLSFLATMGSRCRKRNSIFLHRVVCPQDILYFFIIPFVFLPLNYAALQGLKK